MLQCLYICLYQKCIWPCPALNPGNLSVPVAWKGIPWMGDPIWEYRIPYWKIPPPPFFCCWFDLYTDLILTFSMTTNSRSRDNLLVRAPDLWWKGCEFESQQEWHENFHFVCWLIQCLFHPHVTAVACRRPWSFCQKCRWQVTPKHTYTLNPTKSEWADCAAVQA